MPLPLEETDARAPKKPASSSQVTDSDARTSLDGSNSRASTQPASTAKPSKPSSDVTSQKPLQLAESGPGSQGPHTSDQPGRGRGLGGGGPKPGNRDEEKEATRKAFAESALRRFRVKLEGLSEQGGRGEGRWVVTLSVEEQVEKLLQQATSIDSLAQMYEGWTPWI